jgi:hypothetical protein
MSDVCFWPLAELVTPPNVGLTAEADIQVMIERAFYNHVTRDLSGFAVRQLG